MTAVSLKTGLPCERGAILDVRGIPPHAWPFLHMGPGKARRGQEEPGGARRGQEEPGGAKISQGVPGPGGAQEKEEPGA